MARKIFMAGNGLANWRYALARDKKKSEMSLAHGFDDLESNVAATRREGLERNRDNSKHDTLLFSGVFMAVPVLLALATEIALKAWLYKEKKETPDRRHDLLDLYDDLGEITRKRLEAKVPEVPHPLPGFPMTCLSGNSRDTVLP